MMSRKSILKVSLASSLFLLGSTTLIFSYPKVAISQNEVDQEEIQQRRARIAVLDFEFSPSTTGSAIFFDNGSFNASYVSGAARGTSDILVDRLVRNGTYIVVERSQIDAILREQDLGDAERLDAGTAAQLGRLLGVDAVVMGTITKFDAQASNRGVSVFGIGNRRTVLEANVQLNVRLVSTSTGEILMTAQGVGSADEDSRGLQVGTIFSTSNDNQNTGELLAVATDQAIEEVLDDINAVSENLAALPPALPPTGATIADVTGNTIIVNRGNSDGYRVGMCLSVERLIREVSDPETGEVIHRVTESAGQINLINVTERSSIGELISGTTASLNVGDIAEPVNCTN
ncbi:MAG: CsgG/HfaB family protein [Elainellaceae cyanobacterium]